MDFGKMAVRKLLVTDDREMMSRSVSMIFGIKIDERCRFYLLTGVLGPNRVKGIFKDRQEGAIELGERTSREIVESMFNLIPKLPYHPEVEIGSRKSLGLHGGIRFAVTPFVLFVPEWIPE